MDTKEEHEALLLLEQMRSFIKLRPGAIELSVREMDILLEGASHTDYTLHILSISSVSLIVTFCFLN